MQLSDTLCDWLAIDSTTGREGAFLETLEEHLSARGFECRRQPIEEGRWNLVATPPGNPDPALLYSTHVDTVPPHLPVRREPEAADDGDAQTVYGRGACDTKGGLLAMVEAAGRLRQEDRLADEVGFLLVVGEEVDHRGAREARQLDLHPERIILCEPTQNRVVGGQKGMLKVELRADGQAAHSAYPERGDSAVHSLLDALEAIRAIDWPTDEELGETTLNVGILEGGVAANVMAPSARAELLFRAVSPTEDLLERVRRAAEARVRVEPVAYNDPVRFELPDADLATTTVAFNTDASYLSALGPVWLVGPGDIQVAHSDHEHIDMAELRDGIDLYETLGRLAVNGEQAVNSEQ